jgi:PTS system nitrogen regulatory IIA component
MHAIINHLIQFQDLSLIRTEQQTHRRGARLAELNGAIHALTGVLPPDIGSIVTRLLKRDGIFIVPITQGGCAGCGMKLPISMVQAVRMAETIHHCPVCMRILYYPVSPVRNMAAAPKRSEPRRVGVSRFSAESLMIHRLAGTTRDDVLREISMRIQQEGFVDDGAKLFETARAREDVVSTALDHGMAFPHSRGVEGGGLTLAVALSPKGVQFTADDKTLTRIFFFMVIPTAASAFYLKLIAGLAETFSDAESRKALLAAEGPDKMWKCLVKMTRKTIT